MNLIIWVASSFAGASAVTSATSREVLNPAFRNHSFSESGHDVENCCGCNPGIDVGIDPESKELVVKRVLPGSEAASEGVQRGAVVTHVDSAGDGDQSFSPVPEFQNLWTSDPKEDVRLSFLLEFRVGERVIWVPPESVQGEDKEKEFEAWANKYADTRRTTWFRKEPLKPTIDWFGVPKRRRPEVPQPLMSREGTVLENDKDCPESRGVHVEFEHTKRRTYFTPTPLRRYCVNRKELVKKQPATHLRAQHNFIQQMNANETEKGSSAGLRKQSTHEQTAAVRELRVARNGASQRASSGDAALVKQMHAETKVRQQAHVAAAAKEKADRKRREAEADSKRRHILGGHFFSDAELESVGCSDLNHISGILNLDEKVPDAIENLGAKEKKKLPRQALGLLFQSLEMIGKENVITKEDLANLLGVNSVVVEKCFGQDVVTGDDVYHKELIRVLHSIDTIAVKQ